MRHRKHARPHAPRLDPALVEAIHYIPVPAFIVSAFGEVVAMNGVGHAWLDAVPARSLSLTQAAGPDPEVFRVTPSRANHRSYNLVVLRHAEDEQKAPEPRVPARWGLTPREQEVTACILRGVTNQQIATELGCANATVERHITSILRKANVGNRASLIVAIVSA